MAGIAADVGHVDVDILDMEGQALGVLHPYDVVVDVAMHGPQGLEVGQGLGRLDAADVARMPQLIHVFEEMEELWYEGAMGVRQDADFQHVISG